MIQEFVEVWNEHKDDVEKVFRKKHPDNYRAVVTPVIEMLYEYGDSWAGQPDPNRITEIDHGDYQGTLVYVIGETGYQPNRYWMVLVGYGSCSGCDTLQAIGGYFDDDPSDQQVKEYMQLALHIIQGLKEYTEVV